MLVGPVTGGVSAEAPFLCRLQGEMITFTIYSVVEAHPIQTLGFAELLNVEPACGGLCASDDHRRLRVRGHAAAVPLEVDQGSARLRVHRRRA